MFQASYLKSLHVDHQLVFENVLAHAFTETIFHRESISPIHELIAMTLSVSSSEWDYAGAFFFPLLATKRLALWDMHWSLLPRPITVSGYLSHFSQSFGLNGYEIDCEITVPW